jgi:hypothetical protein
LILLPGEVWTSYDATHFTHRKDTVVPMVYANIYLFGGGMDTAEVYLRGPGAPDKSVSVRWSNPKADHGPEWPDHVCLPSGGCGWSVDGLTEGTYYIEAVLAGWPPVRSDSFKVIATPGAAGARQKFQVDPQFGFAAYRYRDTISVNVPVDARQPTRLLTMAFFKDGALLGAKSKVVEGPGLNTGPVATLSGVELIDEPEGWEHAIVVLGSGTVAGAWSSQKNDGFGRAIFPKIDAPPAEAETATAAARKKLQELAKDGRNESLLATRPVGEGVVCGFVQDPKIVDLVRGLAQLAEVEGSTTADTIDASQVANSRYATERERADARKTVHAGISAGVTADAIALDHKRKLTRASGKYPAGCLAKLLGPAWQPMQAILSAKDEK